MTVSTPLLLALGWVILANLIALFPSPKRHHWPAAYALIAVGVPLLVWLYIENGIWAALVFLIAGASVLRWPVRFLFRWIRGRWFPGARPEE